MSLNLFFIGLKQSILAQSERRSSLSILGASQLTLHKWGSRAGPVHTNICRLIEVIWHLENGNCCPACRHREPVQNICWHWRDQKKKKKSVPASPPPAVISASIHQPFPTLMNSLAQLTLNRSTCGDFSSKWHKRYSKGFNSGGTAGWANRTRSWHTPPCCAERFKNAPRRAAPETKLGIKTARELHYRRPGFYSELGSSVKTLTLCRKLLARSWRNLFPGGTRSQPDAPVRSRWQGCRQRDPEDAAPHSAQLGLRICWLFFFLCFFFLLLATQPRNYSPHKLIRIINQLQLLTCTANE